MPFVPENTIEEILSRTDIVEVVSSYIPLKRIGRSLKALCPFHHEKTPSFVINSEKQIFHCFGCNTGGNAITFLMQYERMNFPEALEVLAKKANVVIPQDAQGASSANQGISTQLYKINELAANFYASNLNSQNPAGTAALNYLVKRGISQETVKKFKIGLASEKWDALINHLRAKNVPLLLMEKCGLIIAKEDGSGHYDRFRKRLIIPIVDVKDRVIAFGARVLDNSLPKYLNSPETPVYSKGKNIFGLSVTRDAVRKLDEVIIVEGYFDLIGPYQAGINNVSATCGTALTIEQVRLLKRYTKNIVMVYDPDNAGQNATLRSLDLLLEEDLAVKVVRLPAGCDPDAYVREYGPDKFRKLIAEAQDVFDYKFHSLKQKYNTVSITDKAKIVSEILPTISKFSSQVVKSAYIKKLAEELRVDEASLRQELKNIKVDRSNAPNLNLTDNLPFVATQPMERLIVKLILGEQELIERLRGLISPDDFQDKHLAQIAAKMFDLFSKGERIEPHRLLSYFSDSRVLKIISEIATMEGPVTEDKGKMLNDALSRMRELKRKARLTEVLEQIKQAEARKDEKIVQELLKEAQSLNKKEWVNETNKARF